MGKAAKEHRKKVQARNAKLKQQKAKVEKMQREFIMNLIKQEQEKGMFENLPSVDGPVIDGPIIDGPIIDGPIIDGPIVENIETVSVEEVENVETENSESESSENNTEN